MVCIPLWICSRNIPAAHAAGEHGLLLSRRNATPLVYAVGQSAVHIRIAGVPVTEKIPALPSLDADQRPVTGQDGPAEVWQTGERIRREFFFFRLDVPAAGVPKTHIQLAFIQLDSPLLESLAPAIRSLAGDLLSQCFFFLRQKFC